MLLDQTYFRGELYIPYSKFNTEAQGVQKMIQTVGENTLEWYIDKYEREYLIRLLDNDLYQAFTHGLGEDPVRNIWISLRDSIYFQPGNSKLSPSANYVYFMLCRRGRSQLSGKGEVRGDEDFSLIVDDDFKLCQVWNEMCKWSYKVKLWIQKHWNDYKKFTDYKFLYCNDFETINTLGI